VVVEIIENPTHIKIMDSIGGNVLTEMHLK